MKHPALCLALSERIIRIAFVADTVVHPLDSPDPASTPILNGHRGGGVGV